MSLKSILRPSESVMASAATIGAVYGVYQLNIGSVASAQASDANHPVLASARKKAGYTALVLVGGLFLVTKDANIAILGSFSIVAMELSYRHAIMAHPMSQIMQPPDGTTSYIPAGSPTGDGNVVDMSDYQDASGY